MPKKGEADRQWVLIDLDGVVLGRAATRIANVLRGKHRPTFTPHMDMGDFVIAINVDKVKLTGKKLTDKIYYRHSGYKGGLKESTAGELLESKPAEILRLAVSGMLPKNASRKHYLKKLKIYAGEEHPHKAQQAEVISVDDKAIIKAAAKAEATESQTKKTEKPKTTKKETKE